MSEQNKAELTDVKISSVSSLNLSMIISSVVLGGALMVSASTMTPIEDKSNIIGHQSGKVEMGEVFSETTSYTAIIQPEEGNPSTYSASTPEKLVRNVTVQLQREIDNANTKIERSNKRKQKAFDYDMKRYDRNMEKYDAHLASLEKGEQPSYDMPKKPVLDLKKNQKFDEMYLTINGELIVRGAIVFQGSVTKKFTLTLEDKLIKFTKERELSLPDLIEFIEDASEDLHSEYEDNSLMN